ncbi:MAG: phospho-N-acetylmuramoyl-pentapeptide-transferase [Defluviitaleaceae bacterium]|nr:phospho-N-acetylmuramoyl-pentapeptide-transferase [Defluviitaleaceae bacterium]
MNNAIYAVIIAFLVNIVLCPVLIPALRKLKFGQQIRGDGPQSHLKKAGTPTMGGIMIMLSFLLAAAVFMRGNPHALAVVLATLGFGIIGFLDDFISITKKRSLGLRAWQKLLGQIIVSVGFVLYWRTLPGYTTEVLIPFFPDLSFNLGYVFPVFVVLVFLSCSNGANLTDGLDGFAAGVTALIAVFFMFAAWILDSPVLPVAGAAAGSLMGFLLFNSHPAKLFMGDTGSLALGGFVAATALLLQMPLFLLIVAIVYVIQSASSMIQVVYFKLTGGKRFFKMAPFHHSLELSGWAETKIVAFFCVVTAIACLVGYLALIGLGA